MIIIIFCFGSICRGHPPKSLSLSSSSCLGEHWGKEGEGMYGGFMDPRKWFGWNVEVKKHIPVCSWYFHFQKEEHVLEGLTEIVG